METRNVVADQLDSASHSRWPQEQEMLADTSHERFGALERSFFPGRHEGYIGSLCAVRTGTHRFSTANRRFDVIETALFSGGEKLAGRPRVYRARIQKKRSGLRRRKCAADVQHARTRRVRIRKRHKKELGP